MNLIEKQYLIGLSSMGRVAVTKNRLAYMVMISMKRG